VKEWPSQVLHGIVQGHPQGIAVGDRPISLAANGRDRLSRCKISPTRPSDIRLALPAEGLIRSAKTRSSTQSLPRQSR